MRMLLNVPEILEHGVACHSSLKISTVELTGETLTYTVKDAAARIRRAVGMLDNLGCQVGDHVTSLAWNSRRHFELFYAVPGSQRVLHTVNPRLSDEVIVRIINEGMGKVLFVDRETLAIATRLRDQLKSVREVVLLDDETAMAELSPSEAALFSYDALLAAATERELDIEIPEDTPAILCFTSGTGGWPKGVVYKHRDLALQTLVACAFGLPEFTSHHDAKLMAFAPLFHANAWNSPFVALMAGKPLLLGGRDMRPENLLRLIVEQEITHAAGVPTVWQMLIEYAIQNNSSLGKLRYALNAGTPISPTLVEKIHSRYETRVFQSWGMTEVPVGSVGADIVDFESHFPGSLVPSGREVFGSRLRIVDEQGVEQPRDGKARGHLRVRGLWSAERYIGGVDALDADGWMTTGDISTINPAGYMTLVDRAKDAIKSGGEWISSVEIERAALSHSQVQMAAAIAIPHDKWAERPALYVKLQPGGFLQQGELLDHMKNTLAKWCLPDEIYFVDEIPITATGKINKMALKKLYRPIEELQ